MNLSPYSMKFENSNNHKFEVFDLFTFMIYVAPFLNRWKNWKYLRFIVKHIGYFSRSSTELENIQYEPSEKPWSRNSILTACAFIHMATILLYLWNQVTYQISLISYNYIIYNIFRTTIRFLSVVSVLSLYINETIRWPKKKSLFYGRHLFIEGGHWSC